jgi:uncharacterized delta-60 repeat protein
MLRLLLFTLLATTAVRAQPVPDASFGGDGSVFFEATPIYTLPRAMAVDAHGRSLVAGYTLNSLPCCDYFGFVTRFGLSGEVEASFLIDSLRLGPDEAFRTSQVEQVAVLPDRRVIVGGVLSYVTPDTGKREGFVAAYVDGRIDTTFGRAGVVRFGETSLQPVGIVGANGSIYVALSPGGAEGGRVVRLGLDGTADPSFGTVGVFHGPPRSEFTGMTARPDGRLVIVGSVSGGTTGFQSDILVLSILAGGAADTSFSGDGSATEDIFGSGDAATAVTLRSDGRLLITGTAFSPEDVEVGTVLLSLLPGGSPDPGFGFQGWTWTDVIPGSDASGIGGERPGVAYEAAGGTVGLIVGGSPTPDESRRIAALGFLANGDPDPAYGESGITRLYTGINEPVVTASANRGASVYAAGITYTSTDPYPSFVLKMRLDLPTAAETIPEASQALTVAPNPIRAASRVSLRLDAPTAVRVMVLDALGRTVAVVVEGVLGSGQQTFDLDATALPPGVYAVVAVVGAERSVTRLTVVR